LKFHDLRKTFGSMLAQNGISTAVTQRLLEHSSPYLTNKVYTNVDPVLRYAVEQLPVAIELISLNASNRILSNSVYFIATSPSKATIQPP